MSGSELYELFFGTFEKRGPGHMISVRKTPCDVYTICTLAVAVSEHVVYTSCRSVGKSFDLHLFVCFFPTMFPSNILMQVAVFLPVLEDFLQRSGHKSLSD